MNDDGGDGGEVTDAVADSLAQRMNVKCASSSAQRWRRIGVSMPAAACCAAAPTSGSRVCRCALTKRCGASHGNEGDQLLQRRRRDRSRDDSLRLRATANLGPTLSTVRLWARDLGRQGQPGPLGFGFGTGACY